MLLNHRFPKTPFISSARFSLRAFYLMVALYVALSAAHAERRALVIGNDDYQSVVKLRNAGADADAMATGLRKAGYQVTLMKDRSLKQMKDDVRTFKGRIRGGDEIVLFYSGHGVQIGAMNYLLPIDVRSESEDQVKDDALALSKVLEDLRDQKPALTLAIIDACRDNPFTHSGQAIGGKGLTGVSGWDGQMVIYSAGEGQMALDRLGKNDPVRNGLFTRVFVREMEKSGLTVDQVARNVREEVYRLARSVKHNQVPAIYDQVLGRFYFYGPDKAAEIQGSHDTLEAQLKSKQQELERLQASISQAKAQQAEMNAQQHALLQKQREIAGIQAGLEDTRMQQEELDKQKQALLQKQKELETIHEAMAASERRISELDAAKKTLLTKQEELNQLQKSLREQEAGINAATRQTQPPTKDKEVGPSNRPLIVPSF
ncbi:MAG TPA: caspase family protein [Noviherbaspirillum sp.]|nr:caspase family protein [Noviherbaspirillum sp.]